MPRRKRTKDSWTKEENRKVMGMLPIRSKPKKRDYRIWKQEGMKEVSEQQICDQRRQIEEKH